MNETLMTRDGVKAVLGLEFDDDRFDEAIDRALPIVTRQFEQYCDRGLAERVDRTEQQFNVTTTRVYTWAYPLTELLSVDTDGTLRDAVNYVVNPAGGWFQAGPSAPVWFQGQVLTYVYSGGYPPDAVPADLALAFANAVGVRSGVPSATASAGGTSAIKAIGLGGGALSVTFDSAAQAGGISGAFDVSAAPPEVQPYVGVLDYYVRPRC